MIISHEIMNHLNNLVPSTRYQGSKRRILSWLYDNFKDLEFYTVLDGFGGTGSVSYLFKLMEKEVTFNDVLVSNYQTGIAFIENNSAKLDQSDIEFLLSENGFNYPTFIQDTFKGIYYFDFENKWLDMVNFNIGMLSTRYSDEILETKKALAYHALFQACLCKRPFNLFHRKNLYLREAKVKRSFGNKKTWEIDFSTLFIKFAEEASQKVFSNEKENKAICKDIMKLKNKNFDLVYLDPPYTRVHDKHPKDYFSFYHFFEGLVDYENWSSRIDLSTKNKCLIKKQNKWEKNTITENFKHIFEEFQDSIIAISYGHPGSPSIQEIKKLLSHYKSDISIIKKEYSYKLNHKNGNGMYEVLIIGK
jgi:adenine-specific DNA-methyltransferase